MKGSSYASRRITSTNVLVDTSVSLCYLTLESLVTHLIPDLYLVIILNCITRNREESPT